MGRFKRSDRGSVDQDTSWNTSPCQCVYSWRPGQLYTHCNCANVDIFPSYYGCVFEDSFMYHNDWVQQHLIVEDHCEKPKAWSLAAFDTGRASFLLATISQRFLLRRLNLVDFILVSFRDLQSLKTPMTHFTNFKSTTWLWLKARDVLELTKQDNTEPKTAPGHTWTLPF